MKRQYLSKIGVVCRIEEINGHNRCESKIGREIQPLGYLKELVGSMWECQMRAIFLCEVKENGVRFGNVELGTSRLVGESWEMSGDYEPD